MKKLCTAVRALLELAEEDEEEEDNDDHMRDTPGARVVVPAALAARRAEIKKKLGELVDLIIR